MDLNLAKRYGWTITEKGAEVHFDDISYFWENNVFWGDIGLGRQKIYEGNDDEMISSLLDVGVPYVEKFDMDIEIEEDEDGE